MKILRITSLGYEGGGTENGILLMQDALAAKGVEVRTLSSDREPQAPHFNHYEFPALSRQPLVLQLVYRLFYPQAFFATRRALRDFRPDLVHVHTLTEVSPSALFALGSYPAVLTVHGAEDFTTGLLHWAFPPHFFKGDTFTLANLNGQGRLHYWYHKYLSALVYKRALRYITTVVVLSRFMQKELLKDGIASVYTPNATKLFTPVAINTVLQEVLYVGRLEKVKGVQYLLDAFARLNKNFPNAHLTVAGDGSYKPELEAQAAALGVASAVSFAGHINRDRLYELYKRASVVVVPSLWPEAFGKVGIEAMSVGRPVIGSDVGGIGEWLQNGEVGYLVPPADATALAEKISLLFADPALLRNMARRALCHVQAFSIEAHAASMIQLYEKVIKEYQIT